MRITVGETVGPFEIVAPLGQGGMGEVFRARDTRLGRDVALKFLRVDWASDTQSRARFEREARAIASLSHPNIGALYDVGQHDGSPFLVMECLEGQTLSSRLARGAMPLPEALRIGAALAEALACAHRAGIVHRDFKPGNVMLTRSGVKLLDFGLAKATGAEVTSGSTAMLTEPLAVLGTLPYMSPEQLTGRTVDARTDIFAFGAVLFEMVAGRRLFEGASGAQITSAILRDEPARVEPPGLDRVIRRCLAKDADQRWQSILDVGAQLAWVAEANPQPGRTNSVWKSAAVGAVAVIAVAALAWPGGLLRMAGETGAVSGRRAEPAYASITLGQGQRFVIGSRPNLAISRDGKAIAFAGRQNGVNQLFVRRFSQPLATSLGFPAGAPFFSPDGAWLGFTSSDGRLCKVAVTGGPVVTIAEVASQGAVWTSDGEIVFEFAGDRALWIVPAAGGTARPLTRLDENAGERSHSGPFTLADGRIGFVSTSSSGSRLVAHDVRTGQQRVLIENAAWGTYVAQGRWLFSRARQLFTVSADGDGNPRIADPPVLVTESAWMNDAGVPFLAASDAGDLIFLAANSDERRRSLVWVDQGGRAAAVAAPQRAYQFATVAPDGRRVALSIADDGGSNAWLYEFSSQELTPLTTDGKSVGPFAWSPDSRELMYSSMSSGFSRSIRRLRVAAPGVTETVLGDAPTLSALSWLRDGRVTIHWSVPTTNGDVMMLDPSSRRVTPLVVRPGNQWGVRVSADGKWLAYVSNESGKFEAMVARLSEPNQQWQVSLGGGQEVIWSRTGLELYYRTDSAVMAATINPNADPPITAVRRLFDNRYLLDPTTPGVANYDIGPDGRFLMIAADDNANAWTMRVVFNWSAGGLPAASSP